MSIRAHGIKTLGLCFLAAVSLMAIGAREAGATASQFLINGSTAALTTSFGAEVDLLIVYLIPAFNLEIDCGRFKVLSGELTTNTGHGLLEVLLESCNAYAYELEAGTGKIINLQEEAACEIYESALDRTKLVNEGNILVKALLLALLHLNGETIIKVEPKEGETIFTKIFAKNCILFSTADLGGTVDLLLHTGGDQVKHLVEEADVGLSQLKYGVNNAFLDGSMWAFLIGVHTNDPWGVATTTKGLFLVDGSRNLDAEASGEVDLLGALLVPAITLEIDCAKFSVKNGELTASTGHGLAELLYEECNAYAYELEAGTGKIINLQEEAACEIYESALDRTKLVNEGNILAKALLVVLLHRISETEIEKIVKAEPKEGETKFAKIFFKNCLIASVDITGAVDLSFHLGGDQVKHLVVEADVGLSQLKYGANNAFLDGSVWVFLTGDHEGDSWGII